MRQLSREGVIERLHDLHLDWADEEDAETLVGVLLQTYSPLEAWSWLCFWQDSVNGVPLDLLASGHGRDVFRAARATIAS